MNKNNFKSKAWTFVELLICFTLVVMISLFLGKNFKPAPVKSKIFMYAMMKNISRANALIIDKHESLLSGIAEDEDEIPVTTYDRYCMALSDQITLQKSPDCEKEPSSTKETRPNLVFSNGVVIYGLTSDWIKPGAEADYKYKNILIDIDGAKGGNKLWVDRFPMRIFDGGTYSGMIFPVNCGTTDKLLAADGSLTAAADNPYCKANFITGTGTAVEYEFLADNDLISYDIYRANEEPSAEEPEDEDEEMKNPTAPAYPRAHQLSSLEADCLAYGGSGMIPALYCQNAGFRIMAECTTEDACETCENTTPTIGYNVCPKNDSGTVVTGDACIALQQAKNPANQSCFTLLHKPKAGVNIMLQSVLDEVDL